MENKPADQLAEQAVLGCAFIDDFCPKLIVSELSESDFFYRESRDFFKMIVEHSRANTTPIDYIAMRNGLKIDSPVTPDFLHDCITAVHTSAYLNSYIKTVKKNALNRKLKHEISHFTDSLESSAIDKISELIDQREGLEKETTIKSTEVIHDFVNMIEKGRDRDSIIPTGFDTIDNNFSPQAGDLIVVAARTGIGKTNFCTNILANMLSHTKAPCLYCPTEMKPTQFMGRLFPLSCSVPAYKFRSCQILKTEFSDVTRTAGQLFETPFYILDKSSPSINDVRRALKETKAKVLFLDYLGRCYMDRAQTRMREIEKFIVSLKELLLDIGVMGFLPVQLSRRTDFDNSVPKLADLSDSSAIEKEADLVLFLWEDIEKNKDFSLPYRTISAYSGKNRWGNKLAFDMTFSKSSLKMTQETNEKKSEYNADAFIGG